MRAAPIVCSEESPLPASVYDNYAVRRFAAGGLVRRLWLGRGIWCPMGFSPASVPEGFQRTSGKPFGEPAGAYPLPRVETDAPTTAREWDLPSYGALTLFFRWRKKRVQKKASGTATTGKSPLLPILTAGLAMSRAMELDSVHQRLERARARLFPPSKWAGLFPFAAYRRSALPQLALGRLNQCELGCCIAAWMASQHRKQY